MKIFVSTVWIVGLIKPEPETVGIFSSKKKAFAACRTEKHWCAPLPLDFDSGDETSELPEWYFPKVKKEAIRPYKFTQSGEVNKQPK